MNANAKVTKAIPREGGKFVELTLEEGAHRKVKITVPVPEDGIYRKNEWVIYNPTSPAGPTVERPNPDDGKRSA